MTQSQLKKVYEVLEYKVSPQAIDRFYSAFACINRVSTLDTSEKINQAISEIRVGKEYRYKELPTRLKVLAFKFVSNPQSFRTFADLGSVENLVKFIKKLQHEGVNPDEYFFDGVLTYRSLQRGDEKKHLYSLQVETREYKAS